MKPTYIPTLLCDFYKESHRAQYPQNTQVIYSTWTPRTSRIEGVNEVVAFGFQAFVKEYLIEYFNKYFFNRNKNEVVKEYKRIIKYALNIENPDASHIEKLHDLGYLPLLIKAVDEGTLVPIRVPMLTIENTKNDFFWLTNYVETLMSLYLWKPSTNATIALQYRRIMNKYALETVGNTVGVQFQGHDFSMRGMDRVEAAAISGAAHLLSFCGTDTIPAIMFLEKYYNADIENELVGTSIPASEHSVMCAHGKDEYSSFKYLIEDVYPDGFVSIVSDTWNLWKVLLDVVTPLKENIMKRNGRVVIRPDSGDPVTILCGTVDINEYINLHTLKEVKERLFRQISEIITSGSVESYARFKNDVYKMKVTARNENGILYKDIDSFEIVKLTCEQKGVIEILWEIFGGTITEKNYKLLDSHIGAIYGDAITTERCETICNKLKQKGFASLNVVFGIGSFTYQYNTRDTFGFAVKSTYAKINGEEKLLFKDPITDNGVKKSAKGIVNVIEENGKISYVDNLTMETRELDNSILTNLFVNGSLVKDTTLSAIRKKLSSKM